MLILAGCCAVLAIIGFVLIGYTIYLIRIISKLEGELEKQGKLLSNKTKSLEDKEVEFDSLRKEFLNLREDNKVKTKRLNALETVATNKSTMFPM